MSAELVNLWLFFAVMGRVLLITGLGPAIAIAILWERYRIVGMGFEIVHHRVAETRRKAREGCAGNATAQYSARTRGSSFPSFEFLRASVPLWWKRSLRRHA